MGRLLPFIWYGPIHKIVQQHYGILYVQLTSIFWGLHGDAFPITFTVCWGLIKLHHYSTFKSVFNGLHINRDYIGYISFDKTFTVLFTNPAFEHQMHTIIRPFSRRPNVRLQTGRGWGGELKVAQTWFHNENRSDHRVFLIRQLHVLQFPGDFIATIEDFLK